MRCLLLRQICPVHLGLVLLAAVFTCLQSRQCLSSKYLEWADA